MPTTPGATTPGATPQTPDARTASALVRISQRFNDEYDNRDYGPVYDRWDAQSRAVITRADYIRRNRDCNAQQGKATVESANPGPAGAWLVRYELGGQQFVDYWYYVQGRWSFDITRSNPQAARHYALPFRSYLAAVGCKP